MNSDLGRIPENLTSNTIIMKIINRYQNIGRVFATSIVATSAIVQAQSIWDGVYLEAFGGFSELLDGGIKEGGTTGDGSYDIGFLSGMSFGKVISPSWAMELEWFYRSNSVESVSGGEFDGLSDGDFASTNLMLNVIYTLNRENSGGNFFSKVNPYVGVGFGAMQEIDIDFTVAGAEQEHSDNWVPAAQFIAGLHYPISEKFSAFAELRYHYSGSSTLEAQTGPAGEIDADYNGYSALLGLRYSF
jgi:hypothetical protein